VGGSDVVAVAASECERLFLCTKLLELSGGGQVATRAGGMCLAAELLH